jgi:3-methyl-2-oxobutanoate hydroxymethyltransferase
MNSILSHFTEHRKIYHSFFSRISPILMRSKYRGLSTLPSNAPKRTRKMSALELQHLKRKGDKITMMTAYDYPSAKHADYADFDVILVGDSVGMVCLGYDTTQPVTMEDMIHHCKAVRRGAPDRFIVGDMPFGSYESSPQHALANAFRLVKEAGVDAVKLEGGASRAETVQKIVDSGIAVMGHVGLTPQNISVLGNVL